MIAAQPISIYREIAVQRRAEALSKGCALRHFFPHRFYFLPKCGPDGFKLAQRMCGTSDPNACWEIVLYADPDLLREIPPEVFFDDDLVWHQQHLGRPGQVATVDLIVDATDLYAIVHISDVVQRAARLPQQRTRIQNRLKGWHHMLLNAIGNFAIERRLSRLYSPTAAFAMQHTDRKRTVQPALFERIYDDDLRIRFPTVQRAGNWWRTDVDSLPERLILAEKRSEVLAQPKTICVCHDIERGLGHPHPAPISDDDARRSLDAMLAAEDEANIPATYNVVGLLLDEVRPRIDAGGHGIAFHSYDHQIDGAGAGAGALPQLPRCRSVDYRIKGYRAPRSVLTDELSDANLCAHNFEWLASSARSLGTRRPIMANRIVRVPILLDDFSLFQRRMTYPEWEQNLLERIAGDHFVAFGLHDCYAPLWLPHYRDLLRRLASLATLRTVDAVAFDVILRSAQ